jgi:hypothetical protein
MKLKRRTPKIILSIILIIVFCFGGYLFLGRGRPALVPMKQNLYEGVTYRRVVQWIPRPMIAHVLIVDTKAKGIEFLVTPPDSEGEHPLKARTTSQFLDEFGLQIAVNGDGFSPWWSRSPADYYPHLGDPVIPLGFAASKGKVYSTGVETDTGVEPVLYISRRNALTFNNQPNNVYSAISGGRMIVQKGEAVPELDNQALEPQTAIGINRNGRYLYIVVVDGRQPLYSNGITFAKLAELLIKQGAYIAMSLDGGGSSTMVIEGKNGEPDILNSPIDNYIPGRERPVGNHLGIYIK